MKQLIMLSLFALAFCGCQSSQKSNEDFATICANPASLQPGQQYFKECQALHRASTKPCTAKLTVEHAGKLAIVHLPCSLLRQVRGG
jgi:hypothetical protein